jgi:hypothetical protein
MGHRGLGQDRHIAPAAPLSRNLLDEFVMAGLVPGHGRFEGGRFTPGLDIDVSAQTVRVLSDQVLTGQERRLCRADDTDPSSPLDGPHGRPSGSTYRQSVEK